MSSAGTSAEPGEITDGIPRRTGWEPSGGRRRFAGAGRFGKGADTGDGRDLDDIDDADDTDFGDGDGDIDDVDGAGRGRTGRRSPAAGRRRDRLAARLEGRKGGRGAGLSGRPQLVAGAVVLVLLAALGVAGFIVLGGDDSGQQAAPPPVVEEGVYDPEIRRNYLTACLSASNGNERYCDCTLEKLEADYTQEEYLAFNNNVESADSQRIAREVYAACRDLR